MQILFIFKAIRQHLHIVGKHVDSVHCLAWNCSSDLLGFLKLFFQKNSFN